MKKYLQLLADVCTEAQSVRKDRTGAGTFSTFGKRIEIDLQEGFPLLTTKKLYWPGIKYELLWFLQGFTNLKYLHEHNVHIWDEWATPDGELGPIYGKQWRAWPTGIPGQTEDQIVNLLISLQHEPYSRRHIVSAWNPTVLPHTSQKPHENAAAGRQSLAPCHTLFQAYVQDMGRDDKLKTYKLYSKTNGTVSKDIDEGILDYYIHHEDIPTKYLDVQLYARSIDIFVGLPFNIASYALLQHLIAHASGMIPRRLIVSFGDLHLYSNHTEQATEQLQREPVALPGLLMLASPKVMRETLMHPQDCHKLDSMFELIGYDTPHGSIKAPRNV